MNIRALRNKLPGVIIRRRGKAVEFEQRGRNQGEQKICYSVDRKADQEETAALIRSKMPR